jgi:hypothetical protein
MNSSLSRLKPIALATLLAFATAPQVSMAAATYGLYTLDAQYILGASSGTPSDGLAAGSIYQTGGGANFYLTQSDASNNSVFFHTYGYDSSFGTRVSGAGSFFAQTSINYHETFTNTSGVAQAFSFAFNVQEGELGIVGNGIG